MLSDSGDERKVLERAKKKRRTGGRGETPLLHATFVFLLSLQHFALALTI